MATEGQIREQIGTFQARAQGGEWSETEEKPDGSGGKPQVAIKFQITDPNAGEYRGKTYYFNGSLSETKMGKGDGAGTVAERTIQTLKYCGARLKDGDLMDLEGITKNDVDAILAWNEFNGKRTIVVNFVNPRGYVFVKRPLSDDKRKSLSLSMKGLVNKVVADLNKSAGEVGGVPTNADGTPTF
jgi:hypothetical protein